MLGVCLPGGGFVLLGPPVVPFLTHFFGWEGSATKIGYGKQGTLIRTSLLEDLGLSGVRSGCQHALAGWAEFLPCPPHLHAGLKHKRHQESEAFVESSGALQREVDNLNILSCHCCKVNLPGTRILGRYKSSPAN